MFMLLLTQKEVREIRGRFTNIDVKLDKIDTRLGTIEKTLISMYHLLDQRLPKQ